MSSEKTCNSCGQTLSLDCFSIKRDGKFGRRANCKPCEVAKVRTYRQSEAGRLKLSEYRSRPDVKKQIRNSNRRWLAKPENRAAKRILEAKHPERIVARKLLNKAIRNGDIVPLPCIECGAPHVEAHHPSYDYPLVVTWLCAAHHKQLHAEHRKNQP